MFKDLKMETPDNKAEDSKERIFSKTFGCFRKWWELFFANYHKKQNVGVILGSFYKSGISSMGLLGLFISREDENQSSSGKLMETVF